MSFSSIAFGMQCFWGAEAIFGSKKGVHLTKVGYAGGTSKNPTYRNLADHIETVYVEFDSTVLKLEEILNFFYDSHDPTIKHKRQYQSSIFYTDEEQKKKIQKNLENRKRKFAKIIVTEIIKLTSFTDAENYHQKYFLQKNFKLFEEIIKETKFSQQNLFNSEIATKLNSFCAGFGTEEQLSSYLITLNFKLSEQNIEKLKKYVKNGPNLNECGI